MKFDDLIETIDALDAEEIDAVVDWQLTESAAAKAEADGVQVVGLDPGLIFSVLFGVEPLSRLIAMITEIFAQVYQLPPELSLDLRSWFPSEMRCAQCQRFLPEAADLVVGHQQEQPVAILPSYCEECARMAGLLAREND